MHKGKIIILCIVGGIGLSFVLPHILDALLLFLLGGVVPGTSHSISPTIMLSAIIVLSSAVLVRMIVVEAIYWWREHHKVKRYETTKRRLPKRRFGHI